MQLIGHQGKIECLSFHSVFSDLLASSDSDGTIKLWNMTCMTDKISLKLPDDAFSQSFCFDYMGERMVSITSKSLLQIFDLRSKSSSLQVETQHSRIKSSRVVWLHPDPLVVSTGFDKSSNRTLFLWDIRKLDKSVSEYSFGSSYAQIEPIWDSELPLLYLPARNESLAMMELKSGLLYQTSIAKMEKTASCLELLPKSLCDTSICEIARFLRLGSDQSIDTVGIHVPRVNSDSVFQQDLYPEYSLISIKDSNSWLDNNAFYPPAKRRVPTLSPEQVPLFNPVKDDSSQKNYPQDGLKEILGYFNVLLERKSWWILKKWVDVSIFLRNNIYIIDSENNPVVVDVPAGIYSLLVNDEYPNRLTLTMQGRDLLLQFKSQSHVDQFIDALSKCFSLRKSLSTQSIFAANIKISDPFQRTENLVNWNNWPVRYMILQRDAVLLVYDQDDRCRKKDNLLKVIDLQHLLGIFRIQIKVNQCPSGRLYSLPIFVFRLVFAHFHYLICVKSEKQLNLWIESIISCLEGHDFYLPGYCATDPKYIVHVEILETVSNSKANAINLKVGQTYNLLVLSDSIQFADDHSQNNPLCLSITRSCISEMKLIDDNRILLIYNDYQIVKIKFPIQQDVPSAMKILKTFMSQHYNIPASIGVNSAKNLKTLMDESIDHQNICFFLDEKSNDYNIIYLIGFGDDGEIEAFIPNSNSIYCTKSYVLETKTEIFHWMGPTSKRRIHAKALDLAVKIRNYRNLRPKITLVEFDDPKTVDRLFSLLGSLTFKMPPASGQDQIRGDMQLLRINSKARHISEKVILISESKRFSRKILNSKYVYIVSFQNFIFLWSGSASTNSDKQLGKAVIRRLAKLQRKVSAIGEVSENLEHPIFWEAFYDAGGSLPIQINIVNEEVTGKIAKSIEQKEIDLRIFQAPLIYEEGDKDLKMVDLSLFRISNFRLEPVTNSPLFLKSSDSYLLLYLYNTPLSGVTKAIVFFWQGSKSAIIEKGAAAILTMEVSSGFEGEISQVRVEEGNESIQFCRLLGGINITDADLSFPLAFDIRSNGPDYPCKSYQVSDFRCIPWNINHVILLLNEGRAFIWKGQFCLESEIEYAKNIATKLGFIKVNKEDDFHKLNLADLGFLNANKPLLKSRTTRFKERFFQTVSVTGAVELYPINNIQEPDIKNVIVLDNLENIYIWISESSNPLEIKTAIVTVQQLILSCPIHHKSKCYVTFRGHEPFDFKASIHGWRNKSDAPIVKVIPANDYLTSIQRETYPLTALMSKQPPHHLDRTKLESYLDKESFANLFQMSREEYNFLPLWKRDHLKKTVGFF